MAATMSTEAAALQRAVGEVLHYIWDPIGVAGVPEARNEYDGYVGRVCSLLWLGADAEALTAHLVGIADESMGLVDTRARAEHAANALVGWRDVVTR